MKRLLSCLAIFLPMLASGKDEPAVAWPELRTIACVSARAATPDDVNQGRAVFVLADAGKPIGVPMKITIPQYAYHVDAERKRTPCVVIQAEEARGQRLIGCILLPGREIMAGMFTEFELLGTEIPSSK
ncbi:MAG TPA: hypothetical protein PLV33_01675 [Opitutaceae bacterium]|jgi:hypothetical protein|nr:hypothetical protein [Opitutaceae bacterium]HOR24706.1 hypothetical protein [Opitutaceae bacterium]HPK48231.1 hypothetical protein [Opitutaceae bacterium]